MKGSIVFDKLADSEVWNKTMISGDVLEGACLFNALAIRWITEEGWIKEVAMCSLEVIRENNELNEIDLDDLK